MGNAALIGSEHLSAQMRQGTKGLTQEAEKLNLSGFYFKLFKTPQLSISQTLL